MRAVVLVPLVVAGGVALSVWPLLDRTPRDAALPFSVMPAPEKLQRFATQRIFFAHQSVGYNILDGLAAMAPEFVAAGVKEPAVREISTGDDISGPGVYHTRAGRNGDPLSKIAAFEDMLVTRGIGAKVDAAVLKFCYVDFPASVSPEVVSEAYWAAIARIKTACPNLTFVHATSPLTTHVWGLKSRLRTLLKGDASNVRRGNYNRLLCKKAVGAGPIFDVAAVESTRPDGTREEFSEGGLEHAAMFPGYTTDSGHLNAEGAKRVAAAFIEAVAGAR